MRRLTLFLFLSLVLVGTLAPALAQTTAHPSQVPADTRQAMPPKAELRKDVELAPVALANFQPSQVPAGERVPFYCVVDRQKATTAGAAPPVEVWLSIRSEQPVKSENLHVHVQVPLVDAWTFKVVTKNYSLYPRWTWIYYPGSKLPANYNLPPPGQPLLRCDAFGWYPKQ
jgi:hypothetical protein